MLGIDCKTGEIKIIHRLFYPIQKDNTKSKTSSPGLSQFGLCHNLDILSQENLTDKNINLLI